MKKKRERTVVLALALAIVLRNRDGKGIEGKEGLQMSAGREDKKTRRQGRVQDARGRTLCSMMLSERSRSTLREPILIFGIGTSNTYP